MKPYLAHIRDDPVCETRAAQTVEEHCRHTAAYAAQALEPAALSAGGYLAGLIHDAGKFTSRFQEYLLHGTGARGSVNHTFAGVRLLLERYHDPSSESEAGVVSEVLALAAGGHHGLFDCAGHQQSHGFEHRLHQEGIGYEEALDGFFRFCAAPEELDRRFQEAQAEMAPVLDTIRAMTGPEASDDQYDQETAFYAGLLARLLLSAVIEGDRRDTAEFMNRVSFPEKWEAQALTQLWGDALEQVERKLETLPHNSEIDRARRALSEIGRQSAGRPGGIFRLDLPTGSGKTLTSLRYALAHAQTHGKQRILFVSPLLSILDQNARVIRDYLQNDAILLEHHSNLVQTRETPEELDRRELLTENWDAPVIITTLVQLLNTLFSGKTTAIRRFHALCGSILVIDEVQTVPSHMLSLFSLALNFLAEIGGAAIVLCSATQPCMEKLAHPLHLPIPELVPYDPALWQVFRRTAIQSLDEQPLEQIALLAMELLETKDSLLVVCNTKEEALRLFRLLEGADAGRFLLSAAMCMAHRQDTIRELQASLAQTGRKTLCVSTQVIEAGVDISFACVIRLAAGMDSVIQAAGRCNRHGEDGPGGLAPVYLIPCRGESLARLPDIQRGKEATLALLCEFAQHPEAYRHALDSDEAIRCYYRVLYQRTPGGHHDYPVPKQPYTLFSLLARNEYFPEERPSPFYFRQAFRTAGDRFEVFDQGTTDVIVPYGKGAALIPSLCGEKAKRDPRLLKTLLEAAKPYTVSLYPYQIDRLSEEGGLIPLEGGAWGLNGHYDEQSGFFLDESTWNFMGVE